MSTRTILPESEARARRRAANRPAFPKPRGPAPLDVSADDRTTRCKWDYVHGGWLNLMGEPQAADAKRQRNDYLPLLEPTRRRTREEAKEHRVEIKKQQEQRREERRAKNKAKFDEKVARSREMEKTAVRCEGKTKPGKRCGMLSCHPYHMAKPLQRGQRFCGWHNGESSPELRRYLSMHKGQ